MTPTDAGYVRKVAQEMIDQARQIGAAGDTIDPSWVEGWGKLIADRLPKDGKTLAKNRKKGTER